MSTNDSVDGDDVIHSDVLNNRLGSGFALQIRGLKELFSRRQAVGCLNIPTNNDGIHTLNRLAIDIADTDVILTGVAVVGNLVLDYPRVVVGLVGGGSGVRTISEVLVIGITSRTLLRFIPTPLSFVFLTLSLYT